MSSYEYWMFNNLPVEYVMKHNVTTTGKVLLNCYAEASEYNDPRDVIRQWQEYEAQKISRLSSLGGKINLQSDKPSYTLTNLIQNFKAVLTKVNFSENSFSNDIILFDLEFDIGDTLFLDKYGKKYPIGFGYNNLTYQQYLDVNTISNILGEEMGLVNLTESYPITRVDIYGYGLDETSWVEVNGQRKYWHYMDGEDRIEKLIFDMKELSTTVQILSPNYLNPSSNYNYYGCNITGICIFYNENLSILETAIEGM